jgi:DNA-binding HxlR family transcriptional regulator
VDYSLTKAGRELQATVHGICHWTRHNLDHIETARLRFESRRGSDGAGEDRVHAPG